MKFLGFTFFVLVVFSCSSNSKSLQPKEEPKTANKDMAGAVMKDVPKTIAGYYFDASINTYFHNSVSDRRRKTVTSTLKNGNRISDDDDKYSRQIELIDSSKIDPLWFQYFKEEIHGTLQLQLRVSSKGFADIIVIEKGIRPDVDVIACQYVAKYKFKPAIGKRSGKEVSSWIRIANQY